MALVRDQVTSFRVPAPQQGGAGAAGAAGSAALLAAVANAAQQGITPASMMGFGSASHATSGGGAAGPIAAPAAPQVESGGSAVM